jgi:hypothetical protein
MLSDTFHSGLLWAAYLLCLLLSGVQSPYPATSVVTVSANTGTSGPTYVNSVSAFCHPPFSSAALTPFNFWHVCTVADSSNSNVKVFTTDNSTLALQLTDSTGKSPTQSAVLKDSLILGLSTFDGDKMVRFLQLSVNSNVMALAIISSGDPSQGTPNALALDEDSSLFTMTGAINIFHCTHTRSTSGKTPVGTNEEPIYSIQIIPSINAFLMGRYKVEVPILARSNFATIKNPGMSCIVYQHLLDNIDDKAIFLFTTSTPTTSMRHYNRITWTANSHFDFPDISLSTFGSANNILNFGPYQYVVTIPAFVNTLPSTILGVSKLTFLLVSNSMTINQKLMDNTPHWGTLMNTGDSFYFVIFASANKNFQSYYLTVSDCTSRDSNRVCQTCQSGLVRNNLMPDNNCVPASDYTGYVADTVNTLLSLCPGNSAAPVGVGCRATDCTGGTTYCTTCDVANSFYLLNGVCYVYASIPDGYGIVTAGQQALAACTDPNCQKCVDNKNTCTQCNIGGGFYKNIGTNLCESVPTVTDTYGFNSGTSQFEPCTDTNCQKCASAKTTCTQCKTASGFFKNIGTGVCETVATVTDTYGFNSGTSQFEPCTDTNCQKCASAKTTCTQCKTSSGYYMNIGTNLCESVPTVTDTYGFNSGTSQFEPCTDTNCQKCASAKTTCTQCKTSSGYYMNIGTNLCESVSTVTDTYGFNSGTSQFEPCTDANCQKCASTKTSCTQCKTASGFYKNIGTNLCESISTVTDTYGFNSGTSQFEPCTDTNCQKCASAKTTCTQCKTSSGYYMNIGTNLCESVSTVTDTYGFNSGTSQFEPCTDTNCQKCASAKTTCTQCKTSSGYYMNIGTNLCESVSTVTDTYGFNSGTSQFEPCTDANCQKCASTKTSCTQCKTASGFYKNIGTNLCESVSTVTDTYGFNSGTSQFEPCTDTNCQKCASAKTTCTQCKTSSGYYMNIGTNLCESVSTVTDTYGFNSGTSQFEPCTDTNCQKCASAKTTCTQCKTSSGYYMNIGNNICQSVATASNGYGFNSVLLRLEQNVTKQMAMFSLRSELATSSL